MRIVWGLVAVVAQLCVWFVITVLEARDCRRGHIPPRRSWSDPVPFPYFCDWYTTVWGDLVGLSLIDWSAGYVFSSVTPNAAVVLFAMLFGAAGTAVFHLTCISPRHRPDSGYPVPGSTAPHEHVHEAYFFAQLSLTVLMAGLALGGAVVGLPLVVALVGAAVYSWSFAADLYLGRFDPIRR